MFRFLTSNLISNYHHNAYKTQVSIFNLVQKPSISFICLLQTLALQSNSHTCNSRDQDNPTVSYLVNKCGLPLHSAVSASKHFTIINTQKADSVLQLFNSYDLTHTQITNLLTKCPMLIQSDSVKTLKPKFEFLESLGLSKPDLAKVISANITILRSSLSEKIIPTVNFLKTILDTNEDLIRALKLWPSLAGTNYRVRLEPNLSTLRAQGVPDLKIRKFLMCNPRSLMGRNEVFQDKIGRVEKLGIKPQSPAFLRCLRVMLGLSDSLWERKVTVFKSFGWSDGDIAEAFRKQPNCFISSEKKVRLLMDFYLNKLGLKSSDVANCPNLLLLSLEKRIKPRCLVLQLLLSKGVISDLNLVNALDISNSRFEKQFVTKYQEVVPEIASVFQAEKGFSSFESLNMLPLGLYSAPRTLEVQKVRRKSKVG